MSWNSSTRTLLEPRCWIVPPAESGLLSHTSWLRSSSSAKSTAHPVQDLFIACQDLLVRDLERGRHRRATCARRRPSSFCPLMNHAALARGPLLLVDVERTHDPLDQPELIVAVDDLEVLRELRFLPMHPQQPMGEPWNVPTHIERTENVQQLFDAGAHLGCRLVGERDRQQAVWRDCLHIDQATLCGAPTRGSCRCPRPRSTSMLWSGAETASRCGSFKPERMCVMSKWHADDVLLEDASV